MFSRRGRRSILGSLGFVVLAFCAGKEPDRAAGQPRAEASRREAQAKSPKLAQSSGRVFYVAPTGTPSGDGSSEAPWDLQTALDQPADVHPGDTILLRGGAYSGSFISNLNGTLSDPIIVRGYTGEWAKLDGGSHSEGVAIVQVKGSYTWFWGFEVMSSDTKRQSGQTGSSPSDILRGDGFAIAQEGGGATHPGLKFINLVVHDARQGFSFWEEAVGGEISGCLIYYNGFTSPDRGHGHGIYTQNQTGTKTIRDNIIVSGFGLGIQAYGSSEVHLDNYLVEGNTIFDSGELEPTGASRNLLIGGSSVARNPQILDNALYRATDQEVNTDLKLGNAATCDSPTITGNYVASSVDVDCTALKVTGNLFYGSPLVGISQSQFPNNTYLSTRPAGTRVFVRPNAYEDGRANITIYNWDRHSTVPVDMSSALTVGSDFEVRNAQDFFGAPVASGTYGGGSITLPMTGLSVASPMGWPAPAPTGPEFNAFVVLTTRYARARPVTVPMPTPKRPILLPSRPAGP